MDTLAVLVPIMSLSAGATVAAFGWRPITAWAGAIASVAITASGIALAVDVIDHGAVGALEGLVRVDALSAFMVIVIGVVATVATVYGVGYMHAELDDNHTTPAAARTYGMLVQAFIAAMLTAVLTDNLGVLWVAVEATTIATAFLVGFRRTRESLEASWKYVVIGSVGVGLALLGTVLIYFTSRQAAGDAHATLNWSSLAATAASLDPGVVRLAIALLILGYGTKIGLAPMHTWLPDAHGQAPAPVSALMSGVLLSVAFYALLRYKVIADAALGPSYLRTRLAFMAVLTLAVAASLLLAQKDYKRLLAYSSIEHMGLAVLGAAIGTPLAVAAALLHVLGHGLVKAVLFCASGEMLLADGTTSIAGVRGLLARRPVVGGVFGFGLLALLGLPPFSLFASEIGIARAGVGHGLGWAIAAGGALLVVVFASIVAHGQRMLLGEADGAGDAGHRTSAAQVTVLVVGLVASAALGVSIWPLERLLRAAAAVVTG